MKSPFKGLKLHVTTTTTTTNNNNSNKKNNKDNNSSLLQPLSHLHDLSQAALEMQSMRDCYDSLLSAAAQTANSAYEFSESLREMGSCLLEKTALHHDEESARVLLILGKVQFELQKLVDIYRSHIFLTITNPSESLLNELRTVEDMKRHCDEKRELFDDMVAQHKEKSKSKSGKGENLTPQDLKSARDEFHEEATLCVFRLKSLKQGQSRSLLAQAARHHAAQLNFFRKALKSLEAVEPHVKLAAEQQHINYQFSGLEDDSWEYIEDDENGEHNNEGRELSFDYRENKPGHEAVSISRNSMEEDDVDISFPQASTVGFTELNTEKYQGAIQVPSREHRVSSYSAPIFPERKIDPMERIKQMRQPSARKVNTYVLPTPLDPKVPTSSKTSGSVAQAKPPDLNGRGQSLWHSSPLEQKKHDKDSSDVTSASIQLPPPLVEGNSLAQLDTYTISDSRKIRRQSFSGPITSKQLSKPTLSSAGPVSSIDPPKQTSGSLPRVSIPQPPSSPKVSPTASPPLVSSPRISELHELPRPPGNFAAKPTKSPPLVGHSAPLIRNTEAYGTKKVPSATTLASPLPTPPLVVSRSFSIPSSSQRSMTVQVSSTLLEYPPAPGEVDSPPLTPISLSNLRAELVPRSGQIRGKSGI